MYTYTNNDRSASTSGNCLEKDAKVEYEEVFDDRRAVQRGNSHLTRFGRRARAGNKYRAVEVSGGVEKERDYFGRRDDRYDDRRDRGYDRRGYDDRDRASCGVPWLFAPLSFPAQASSATARATATTTAAAGTTTTAATAGATTTTAATTAARRVADTSPSPLLSRSLPALTSLRLRCTLLRGELPEPLRERRSTGGSLLLALRGVEDGGCRAAQEHAVPHPLS